MSGPVHLCCASDKDYILPLSALIASAYDHCQDLVVHVLDAGIPEEDRTRLARLGQVEFTTVYEIEQLRDLQHWPRISTTAYCRLLIPVLLPELSKAIYVDCDTIINRDLAALWDIEIGDKAVLAAQEQSCFNYVVRRGLRDYELSGLSPDTPYFNSGVMVMNLAKWRWDRIAERVFSYTRSHSTVFLDQDGLNALLWQEWGQLDPRWNVQIGAWEWAPDTCAEGPFKDVPLREVQTDPWIVHFNGDSKPWEASNTHPFRSLWQHYHQMVLAAGLPPATCCFEGSSSDN